MTYFSSPDNWDYERLTQRDARLHGVQIAFGRIYASGAFGEYPNDALEVARQAAFALIDHVSSEAVSS
jgi:hypothetical protein